MHQPSTSQCLITSTLSPGEAGLLSHVSKLWQMDVLPYWREKVITCCKEDTTVVRMLEDKTIRVEVDGVQWYATPLLCRGNILQLQASQEAVLGHLLGTENHRSQDHLQADPHSQENKKLQNAKKCSSYHGLLEVSVMGRPLRQTP